MKAPVVVVITGIPCTGKTTLGRRIAAEFSLPLVTKDGLKEVLFDSLGSKDRQWSRKLSLASFNLIFYVMDLLLQAGRSHIVEGNFTAGDHAARLLDLQRRHPFRPFQILCVADDRVIRQRLQSRAESGLRHPGHLDRLLMAEFDQLISGGQNNPLEIGGELLEVDTTETAAASSQAILAAVRAFFDITE
jgi:predicted kinase